MPRILFVFTSATKSLTGKSIGWFLPEAAYPYYVLAPHYGIDFAAPAGPNPTVDPTSVELFLDDTGRRFLADPAVKSLLEHAKKLDSVDADNYEAIYYVGGHGPSIDLVDNKVNTALAEKFYQSGKIVAAVCHGPAALRDVKGTDGRSIFAGRTVTSFSNEEEEIVDGVKDIPFSVEDEIQRLGGTYVKADKPWGVKVVRDGTLISAQNPASAGLLGEEILNALQEKA
ncbi:class I glutamine amidotransferase-like protein [Amylostereum chailletii]|nr:class I glutamine amidotransferase-like protein [Amylostereum chailletii]